MNRAGDLPKAAGPGFYNRKLFVASGAAWEASKEPQLPLERAYVDSLAGTGPGLSVGAAARAVSGRRTELRRTELRRAEL